MKIFWLFYPLLFLLSSCQRSMLSNIEESAQALQNCLLHQVISTECVELQRENERVKLKAVQAGIEAERIEASVALGEQFYPGSVMNSPFQRVTRALGHSPFFIVPEKENFVPYKTPCPNFDKIESTDDLVKAAEKITLNETRYQTVSYYVEYDVLYVFLYRVKTFCKPLDYNRISDEFPLITESQLKSLRKFEYHKNRKWLNYNSIIAITFDSYDEAIEDYEERTM